MATLFYGVIVEGWRQMPFSRSKSLASGAALAGELTGLQPLRVVLLPSLFAYVGIPATSHQDVRHSMLVEGIGGAPQLVSSSSSQQPE